MASLNVLLDVDGVLADFLEAARRVTGLPLEGQEYDVFKPLTVVQRVAAWEKIVQPGVVSGMQPMPGALAAVQALEGMADVHVVTTAPDVAVFPFAIHWHRERLEWLHRVFGIEADRVTFTKQKHLVRGDVFIDDRPQNVRRWARANPEKRAILFGAPYNVGGLAGWDAVLREILMLT